MDSSVTHESLPVLGVVVVVDVATMLPIPCLTVAKSTPLDGDAYCACFRLSSHYVGQMYISYLCQI